MKINFKNLFLFLGIATITIDLLYTIKKVLIDFNMLTYIGIIILIIELCLYKNMIEAFKQKMLEAEKKKDARHSAKSKGTF